VRWRFSFPFSFFHVEGVVPPQSFLRRSCLGSSCPFRGFRDPLIGSLRAGLGTVERGLGEVLSQVRRNFAPFGDGRVDPTASVLFMVTWPAVVCARERLFRMSLFLVDFLARFCEGKVEDSGVFPKHILRSGFFCGETRNYGAMVDWHFSGFLPFFVAI